MIAHSLSPAELRTLRAEFAKVDVDGRGVIRPADLQRALKDSSDFTDEEVAELFYNIDIDQDGKIGEKSTRVRDLVRA